MDLTNGKRDLPAIDRRKGQGWMLARVDDATLDQLTELRTQTNLPLTLLLALALRHGAQHITNEVRP